jgi:hypothetical protein
MTTIEMLNTICDGWNENENGMLVNSQNGDIIDIAPAIGEWFIIGDFGVVEGYETRNEAVEAYASKMIKND